MEESSSSPATSSEPLLQPSRTSRAAAMVVRIAGRRGGPSALVRETAALQLEERRADWAYSRPVVAIDVAWNLAFAVVSAVMIALTLDESPVVPLRVWIVGYALQCVVHVALVWTEYRRRRMGSAAGPREREDSAGEENEEARDDGGAGRSNLWSSIAKRCESLNTVVSFVWWIIGFYWVIAGGETLLQDAPMLYWLTVVFLAFDVFFAIFCVALACIIGIALCCCLPCIIAIVYAIAGQEGASDADISILPRYRYVEPRENVEKMTVKEGIMVPMTNNTGGSSDERVLLREDAQCCICLTSYEDGVELHSLPCNHHFHATCIVKWLRINATCPLCKYNILKGNDYV